MTKTERDCSLKALHTTTTATCLSWTKSLWLTQLPHLPSPHAYSKHHGQKAVTYSVWCRQIINLILKCSQRWHFKFELEITSIKFVPSGKLQLPSLTRSSLSLWFTCPSSSLSAFFSVSYLSFLESSPARSTVIQFVLRLCMVVVSRIKNCSYCN